MTFLHLAVSLLLSLMAVIGIYLLSTPLLTTLRIRLLQAKVLTCVFFLLCSIIAQAQSSDAQTILPTGSTGELLHNGIRLPAQWPPKRDETQEALKPSYLVSPPSVIPIDVGRQLFVDDFLIESSTLSKVRHRPISHANNPIVSPENGYNFAMPFSDGVWYDPKYNIYRLFYLAGDNFIWMKESSDGKNWSAPGIKTFYPGGGRDSVTIWLDLEETNLDRRYKAFVYYPVGQESAIYVYFSPDGKVWTRHNVNGPNLSDRTTVFYNPWRKVWVGSVRMRTTLPPTGSRGYNFTRARFYTESRDLNSWTPGTSSSLSTDYFWTGPDVNDPPYKGTDYPELYNLDAVAYESIFVGLFSWFYPQEALVEIGEGFSRDGYQWDRPYRGAGPNNAFIPASNQGADWNGYNTQSAGGGFLVVGNELWFYYSARNHRHGTVAYQGYTGLSILRRDGFVSLHSGATEGSITTRPVKFSGTKMYVNVDNPNGTLAVEILDQNNSPIAPFTRQNSRVISTNSTMQSVTWNGASDLSSLGGRNVKFKFYLTNGDLYSFWVTPSTSGASFGYIAAGGPGFSTNRDTSGNVTPLPAPSPTPVVTPIPVPTRPAQVETLSLEAETASLTSPMTLQSSSTASGGRYIESPSSNSGEALFSFNVRYSGTYYVWSRVLSSSSEHDSFFVSVDGQAEDVFDTAERRWSSSWIWTVVNGRNGGSIPMTLNPRKFELTSGQHTIKFRSRDAQTGLDRITITNDPTLSSDGIAPLPIPPPARCDLDSSGALSVPDVQLCANQAVGQMTCTNGDVDSNGICNVLDLQKVVNGALGGACP